MTFAHMLPPSLAAFSTLFCSSMLNLTELIGLRPDLAALHKIVYFHENQLEYPERCQSNEERDLQLPWIQTVR